MAGLEISGSEFRVLVKNLFRICQYNDIIKVSVQAVWTKGEGV